MYKSCGISPVSSRNGERGSSRLKFLIIFSVVAIATFVGYQYIPIAFQDAKYKDFMKSTVDLGAAQSKNSDWIKEQLVKNGPEMGIPKEATITIEEHEGILQARVQFKRQIPLIVLNYDYNFDETVKSSSLWSIK